MLQFIEFRKDWEKGDSVGREASSQFNTTEHSEDRDQLTEENAAMPDSERHLLHEEEQILCDWSASGLHVLLRT